MLLQTHSVSGQTVQTMQGDLYGCQFCILIVSIWLAGMQIFLLCLPGRWSQSEHQEASKDHYVNLSVHWIDKSMSRNRQHELVQRSTSYQESWLLCMNA